MLAQAAVSPAPVPNTDSGADRDHTAMAKSAAAADSDIKTIQSAGESEHGRNSGPRPLRIGTRTCATPSASVQLHRQAGGLAAAARLQDLAERIPARSVRRGPAPNAAPDQLPLDLAGQRGVVPNSLAVAAAPAAPASLPDNSCASAADADEARALDSPWPPAMDSPVLSNQAATQPAAPSSPADGQPVPLENANAAVHIAASSEASAPFPSRPTPFNEIPATAVAENTPAAGSQSSSSPGEVTPAADGSSGLLTSGAIAAALQQFPVTARATSSLPGAAELPASSSAAVVRTSPDVGRDAQSSRQDPSGAQHGASPANGLASEAAAQTPEPKKRMLQDSAASQTSLKGPDPAALADPSSPSISAEAIASPAGAVATASSSGREAAPGNPPAAAAGREDLPREAALPMPAPAAPLPSAHILERMQRSELRVGINTMEFGNLEVRAAVSDDRVAASVITGHGELRAAMMAEMPSLQQAIEQRHLRLERFDLGPQTGNGDQGGSAQQQPGRGPQFHRQSGLPGPITLPGAEEAQLPGAGAASSGINVHA